MTVISKQLFCDTVDPKMPCWQLFHPWTKSCIKANSLIGYTIFVGAVRFFIPIYIVQALVEYKKIENKKYLINWLKGIMRSTCYAMALGFPVLSLNCLLCRLIGPKYYNIGVLTGAISASGLLLETERNKILDTLIFFNMAIEAILRNAHYFKIFELTKKNETLLFMTMSSCLMYLMKDREGKIPITHLWFHVPHKTTKSKVRDKKDSEKICSHEGNCTDFLEEGVTRYFAVGYVISVIKNLLGKFEKVLFRPSFLINILINNNNVLFGIFTASYVAVYRFFTCYLMKKYGEDRPIFGAIAGLLSGITYVIKPEVQFLVISIVTTLQMLYERLKKTFDIPSHLPLRQILFMISHAILLHNRFVLPETCPKYYKHLLSLCTGGLIDVIHTSIVDTLLAGRK